MTIHRAIASVVLIGILGTGAAAAAVPDSPPNPENLPGAALYRANCAACHEGGVYKAPVHYIVAQMPPDMVYAAMSTGVMQQQAAKLTDAEKRQVVEYLTGESPGAAPAAAAAAPQCTGKAAMFDRSRPPALTAWGFDAGNSHHIPGSVAGLSAGDIPRLKVKWAFAYPGAQRARSQPTLAMGALYVGSPSGLVYALDAATGCIRWTFRATAEVRTPVVLSSWSAADARSARPLAFFGDIVGRVYAVDALTGKLRWKLRADDHASTTLTGAPAYHAGTLYVPVSSLEEGNTNPTYECCKFRGSVLAIAATSGKVLWKTYTINEIPQKVGVNGAGVAIFAPSGAAVWNSPTIDAKRGLLYVGTGDNYSAPANDRSDAILAIDLKNGRVHWSWQVLKGDAWNVGCLLKTPDCPDPSGPDFDVAGGGTMLVSGPSGRQYLYAGTKAGTAVAIDPDTHRGTVWTQKVGRGGVQGGIQFGMASDGTRLYVPISDHIMQGEPQYEGAPRPGMYALDALTGAVLWSQPAPDRCGKDPLCSPGILAAVTSIPGAVLAGHMDGYLRAYAADSGQVLWEYDTRQPIATLSGAQAHGGSIGGSGPVVYDGVVYLNSGYSLYGHLPGNVLYAFSVDGK